MGLRRVIVGRRTGRRLSCLDELELEELDELELEELELEELELGGART